MENSQKLKNIVPAPLFQRTFAAIIDLVITILIGAGVFLGFSSIASNFSSVKAYKNDYIETIEKSNILTYDKKEDMAKPLVFNKYQDYESAFYSFYHDFMPTEVTYTYEHDVYWYNVHIYGLEDELHKYSLTDLNDNVLSISKRYGKTLFTYELDDDNNKLYDHFALPIAYENQRDKTVSKEEETKLINFYYVSDDEVNNNEIAKEYKYVYYYALSELTSIERLSNDYNRFALYGTTLPLVVAIFFTMAIFYLVIPLFFKDGETIGKLVMHICLVNKLGYQYRRVQIVPRALFPTLFVGIILVLTGFSIVTVLILSATILVSFLLVIFTKEHKSIKDYLGGTMVIDKRASTFFKDATEEARYEEESKKFSSLLDKPLDPKEADNVIYINPRSQDKDKE